MAGLHCKEFFEGQEFTHDGSRTAMMRRKAVTA